MPATLVFHRDIHAFLGNLLPNIVRQVGTNKIANFAPKRLHFGTKPEFQPSLLGNSVR